jgi:hypothetical protein
MGYSPFINPNVRGDLRPNAFSSVGGGVNNQFIQSQYQVYKPTELVQLFERHNQDISFRLMIKAMGFQRGVAAPTTGHFENPWRKNLVTVGSIVTASTGPGTSVVIALDAADMFADNATVSGAARQGSYPNVGEILVFYDENRGQITAKNTAVTPHQLTIRPLSASIDLVNSIVVAQQYFIATNAHAEGSDLPAGRSSRVIRYSNTFQIVKEACASSGTNMTDMLYWNPKPGVSGSTYVKVKDDTMKRFEDMCDGALLWGTPNTNNSQFVPGLGHDAPTSGTEGLDLFSATNGSTQTYTPNAFTMADFDATGRYYEQERIGVRRLFCLQGFDINTEIENVLMDLFDADLAATISDTTDYFLSNGGTADRLPEDFQIHNAKEFAANIGFRSVRKGGYTYSFKTFHVYNELMGAGAAGYDYMQRQIMLPVGMTKEKSTDTMLPTFGYEYKQLHNYSREECIEEFGGVGSSGAIGKPAVNGTDIAICGMVSELAFHGTCANHIRRTIPA